MYDYLRSTVWWFSAMADENYRENYWTIVAEREVWYNLLNDLIER